MLLFYFLVLTVPLAASKPPLPTIRPLIYSISLHNHFDIDYVYGTVSIDFKPTEDSKCIHLRNEMVYVPPTTVRITDHDNHPLKITNVVYNTTLGAISVYLHETLKKEVIYRWSAVVKRENQDGKRGFYLEKYKNFDPPRKPEIFIIEFLESKKTAKFFRLSKSKRRSAFPCVDDPRIKSQFKVEMIRPPGYNSVSNQKKKTSRLLPDGTYKDEFFTTSPLSPDQIGFVVGNFTTYTRKPHSFHLSSKNYKKTSISIFLNDAVRIMEILEQIFGTAFPLGKLDHVAVPDELHDHQAIRTRVRGTGMLGLITYKESNALYDRMTIAFDVLREKTVYIIWSIAQQWFGNLVHVTNEKSTWCKESIALYFSYKVLEKLRPNWRPNELFVLEVTQKALLGLSDPDLDSSKLQYRKDNEEVFLAKGAALLGMSRQFLNAEFDDGLPLILKRKMHRTMSFNNFFDMIEENLSYNALRSIYSRESLKNEISRWFKVDGYPVVTISRKECNGNSMIILQQFKFALDGSAYNVTWPIQITYVNKKGNFWKPETYRLNTSYEIISCNRLQACDSDWTLLNINTTGLYRVNYDQKTWLKIIKSLQAKNYGGIPAIIRAQLIDDAFNLARANYIKYIIPLQLAEYMVKEIEYVPWMVFLRNIKFLDTMIWRESWYEEHYKPFILRLFEEALERVITTPSKPSDLLHEQLKNELVHHSCKYGSTYWKKFAKFDLRLWKENQINLNVDTLVTLLECDIRNTTTSKYINIVTERYNALRRGADVNSELELYRNALALVHDAGNLTRLLKSSIGDREEYEKVLKAIINSDVFGFDFAFQYVLEHTNEIEDMIGLKKAVLLVSKAVLTDEQNKLVVKLTALASPEHDSAFLAIARVAGDTLRWSWSRNSEIYSYVSKRPTWEYFVRSIRRWQDDITSYHHWKAVLTIASVIVVFVAAFRIFTSVDLSGVNAISAVIVLLVTFYAGGMFRDTFADAAEAPLPLEILPPVVMASSMENSENVLPRNIRPLTYELNIDVFFDTLVSSGTVSLLFEVIEDTKSVMLNAEDIDIHKSTITDGTKTINVSHALLDKKADTYAIYTYDKLSKGQAYVLTISYQVRLRDDNTGFYYGKYLDETEQWTYFAATQFEPNYARRAFPCIDDPYFKAIFLVNITTPSGYDVAISNGFRLGSEVTDTLRINHRFHSTPIMSTYLFAMVVSKFGSVRSEDMSYGIYGRKKMITEHWGDFALEKMKPITQYFENYTEIPYSIKKLDAVAVPDDFFNAGAMENWGLLIFKESNLLCNVINSTAEEMRDVHTTLAHEVAHQWFGNLVTISSWKDLWLNEGFATFFQYYALSELYPSERWMDQFLVSIMQDSLGKDVKQPLPIAYKVNSTREVESAPKWPVYLKASSVIRMIQHLLTPEVFQAGMKMYLIENQYGSVDTDILFSTLRRAMNHKSSFNLIATKSIKDIMSTWINVGGYPVVTVTRNYDTGDIHIRQTKFTYHIPREEDPQLWKIPLNFAFNTRNMNFSQTTADAWLMEREMTIPQQSKNGWMIVNKNAIGYYRVVYDETNWMRLGDFLDSDEFQEIPVANRAQFIDDSFKAAISRRLKFSIPFKISRYLKREIDYIPWKSFFDNARVIRSNTWTLPEYESFKRYIRNLYQKSYDHLGLEVKPTDTLFDRLHRELLAEWMCATGDERCRDEAVRAFRNWMENKGEIHPSLQSAFFCGAVAKGANDEEFNFLMEQYKSASLGSLKDRFITGMSCTRNKDAMTRLLDAALKNDGILKNDSLTVLKFVCTQSAAGLQFAMNYLVKTKDLGKHALQSMSYILSGLSNLISTEALTAQFMAVLELYGDSANPKEDPLQAASYNRILIYHIRDDLAAEFIKNKGNIIACNATTLLLSCALIILFKFLC